MLPSHHYHCFLKEVTLAAREIEPEILQKLGLFVVRWAALERLLGDLVSKLLCADRASAFVFTETTQIRTITDWCSTLIKFHSAPPEIVTEWDDLVKCIDYVRGQRNAMIHGLWVTDQSGPGTVAVSTINLRASNYVTTRIITLQDIEELIDETLELDRRLAHLIGRLSVRRSSEASC